MEKIEFRITGISPLLFHNDTLLDPTCKLAKEMKALTGQRKKTDETYAAIARVEFLAALHWDSETGVFIPGEMIESALAKGATYQKLGTAIKRTVQILTDKIPLIYPSNNKLPEQLYEDDTHRDMRAVRVQQSKVMRCRPKFYPWSAEFEVLYNSEHMDKGPLIKAMQDTGLLIGIGDYRPRFGKFEVLVLN